MTKEKKSKKEDMEETEDMESEDQEEVRKETEKSNVKKKDAEEDMDEKKKVDKYLEDFFAKNIKDMFEKSIKDMATQISSEVKNELKEDMQIANDVAQKEKDRRLSDLKETLMKAPYEYSKDFLEGKALTKLEQLKEDFEQTKVYKDFVTTQEDMNRPNKEIFNDVAANSTLDRLATNDFSSGGYWGHMYGKKGGN